MVLLMRRPAANIVSSSLQRVILSSFLLRKTNTLMSFASFSLGRLSHRFRSCFCSLPL